MVINLLRIFFFSNACLPLEWQYIYIKSHFIDIRVNIFYFRPDKNTVFKYEKSILIKKNSPYNTIHYNGT